MVADTQQSSAHAAHFTSAVYTPSVGRLWTRYSPARGEITGGKPSVARTRDASHTRIPAQEPKDRPNRSLVQSIPKSIIDKIDRVLAEHYGFTAEELDFIINYDIKYRMGLEG